ncbi:urocanate hydratase (plasmid) [Streptomyces sp. NBC_00841]|uniref:urocanate hydratase n=1 Tax=unclassified Streptomyces TaxID=2593676 RepID=UPI00225AF2B9|nr:MULTISPECIES: urocanate hydratase [unclassified Streptomyces]MCX4538942.1 urocanate hydratase [Streptomyces sp. NBC_01669]WSA04825.1 urocanate hydratase [Streptomyces sp. NBC_00841]
MTAVVRPADPSKPEILYQVRAERGDTLRCKGWKQETILRMLENNMEVAEHPEKLVVYGGIGKAARNWESYHAIVDALKNLANDETLVVQSGMPVAVFETHDLAPRVVMATTNFVRPSWQRFYELQDKNLTIFAQYTAAPWEYIGTQGVIQGTFETLRSVAAIHLDGDWAGKILICAGMGGMGGNQPRAMTMLGGVSVCADVDERIIKRRIEVGYCDVLADSIPHALELARQAADEKRPLGIAVVANATELFEYCLEHDFRPDVVTEMTPAHDPVAYVPVGLTVHEAEKLRRSDRDGYFRIARNAMVRQLKAMNTFYDNGVPTFEYGNQIRRQCEEHGFEDALKIPGFVAAYLRPLFLEGRGPFRWTCTSGDPADLARLDDLVLELFADDELVTRWINLARVHVPIEGLPARVCYLGFGQRKKFGLAVNELIKRGEVKGTVAFSRDNLDSGSIINPTFESENMPDGSDCISDWPYLNGLLNASGMCDLIAIQANYAMGDSVHTGVTMIADGTDEAAFRLKACLTVDSGIGVVRHAQAGYARAKEVAETVGPDEGMSVPLWWTPTATFGPDDE